MFSRIWLTATKMTQRADDPLLELIPRDRLTSEQKALLQEPLLANLAVFELLREPTDLDELHRISPGRFVIWRKNRTVIFFESRSFEPLSERRVCFNRFGTDGKDMNCNIYGETDAAIAETATVILSLKDGADVDTRFRSFSYYGRSKFNFAVLRPEELVPILDNQ